MQEIKVTKNEAGQRPQMVQKWIDESMSVAH